MANLAIFTSGNFSATSYFIIDDKSSSFRSYSDLSLTTAGYYLNNINGGSSSALSRIWCPQTSGTILSATSRGFNFGTTNSITHIGLKINRWLINATLSIGLSDTTNLVDVSGSTITFSTANAFNLYPDDSNPNYYSQHYTWQFFKFQNPLTFSTTATYAVTLRGTNLPSNTYIGYICSTNFNTTIFTQSSQFALNHIMRCFVTSATKSVAATDSVYIQGEFVNNSGVWNSQTFNACTVSMLGTNSATASTGIEISYGGALIYGTASNTNYYLTLNGDLVVNTGGYFGIGSRERSLATSSTATLDFRTNKKAGSGILVTSYGQVETYGATMTTWTYLKNDANSGGFTVSLQSVSNWKSGDSIVISPTGFSYSEYDLATISNIVIGTTTATISTTAALSFSHSGTSPYIAEIANLSRNIKIFGDSTNFGYIDLQGGQVNIQFTEFRRIGDYNRGGTSSNDNTRNGYGISFNHDYSITFAAHTQYTTNASSTGLTFSRSRIFAGCSFNRFDNFFNSIAVKLSAGSYLNTGVFKLDNILIDNNIIFNMRIDSSNANTLFEPGYGPTGYFAKSFTNNSGTFSNNLFIYGVMGNETTGAGSFYLTDFAFINSNITGYFNINSGGPGRTYFSFGYNSYNFYSGDIYNLNFHSCYSPNTGASDGGLFINLRKFNNGNNFKNINMWNCNPGLQLANSADATLENLNLYNNKNSLILANPYNVRIINSTFSSTIDTNIFGMYDVYQNPNGGGNSYILNQNVYLIFDTCNFISVTTSSFIPLSSTGEEFLKPISFNLNFINSTINTSNLVSGYSRLTPDSYIKFDNLNGNTFSSFYRYGYTYRDSVYKLSGSYSTAIFPNTFTYSSLPVAQKFIGVTKFIAASSGRRTQISVWVRKSNTGNGDATTYNGAEVRIMVAANSTMGIPATQIAVTTTASNGSWEKITGITPTATRNDTWEIYLDCDGNTGFINVSDWSITYIQ